MIYKIPDKNTFVFSMPGLKSIFSKEVKGNIKIPNHLGTICITRKKAAHEFQTKNNLERSG